MIGYACKRLLQAFLVIVGVTLITFILVNVVPGDPVQTMLGVNVQQETVDTLRQQLGLDQPLHIQYFKFLKGALTLDFGESYSLRRPVTQLIIERFKITFVLVILSYIFALVTGILLGVLAAKNQGKPIDSIVMGVSMLGISIPGFWIAMILQIVFGVLLNLLPIIGLSSPAHYILPVITTGIVSSAGIARLTRTNLIETINQDYIRTARAKGLSEWIVLFKHAFRNALIPIITLVGGMLSGMLGGMMLIEMVFSIPGLGMLTVQSMQQRDIPLILGTVVYTATLFVVINLIVDVSYGFIDPRVKLRKGE